MNANTAAPSLRQWQQAIIKVCEKSDTKQSAAENSLPSPLGGWLKFNEAQSVRDLQDRLQVYRNNFVGSRLNILEETFPRLLKLLGTDYLRQCGRSYLSKLSESNNRNWQHYTCITAADLNRLGEQFPSFLRELQVKNHELSQYPWLADLATLDFQLHTAYYSSNDPVFDFDSLQEQSEHIDQIRFELSYSLALINSDWPLADINTDIEGGKIQETYPHSEHKLCVYRQNNKAIVAKLKFIESKLLHWVGQKHSMQELLDNCPDCEHYLPQFIQRGWITGFTIGGNDQVKRIQEHPSLTSGIKNDI